MPFQKGKPGLPKSLLKLEGEKPDLCSEDLGNTFITGTNLRANGAAFSQQQSRFNLEDGVRYNY